uniref:Protein C10 n=1 Tax=Acanthochromis polyacanthus TaxID=80966 RepID=A0A3Q1EQY1_9TELE
MLPLHWPYWLYAEGSHVINSLPTVAKGATLRHFHWGGTSLIVFISDMASAPAQQPTLTVEQTRVVLSEVIQAFSVPENAARMEEARESACNDMGKMLQLVLPVATQIQQEVIKAYGFNNEGEGVLKFARLVKMYETQDPEIAAMSAKLKSLLLPPLSTPPIGGAIPAS